MRGTFHNMRLSKYDNSCNNDAFIIQELRTISSQSSILYTVYIRSKILKLYRCGEDLRDLGTTILFLQTQTSLNDDDNNILQFIGSRRLVIS